MTDNPEKEVAKLRANIGAETSHPAAEGIEREEDISDEDAEAIRIMSDRIHLLGDSVLSEQRHEFYLRRAFVTARDCGNLAAALTSREEAERIVTWINREKNDSPETNADYRVALRGFGRFVEGKDDDEPPESLAWVPGGYPNNYDPAPDPSEMFHWDEHILPMLDACHNSRDRALIALAWDAGPRAGELFDLTLDRVTDHKYGLQVTFKQGKQGTRSPILIPSVPYVKQWVQDHPAEEGSNVPMWTRKNKVERVTNNRLRDIFKERARAADITLPSTPTPTQMRKSSASYLASEGVSQAHLEDRHGWTRGSKKASRYVSVFGDANDREIARAHGLDVEADETADISPKNCPRCGQSTPREKERCVWCGQALTPTATKTATEQQNEVLQAAGDLTGEQAAAFAELGQLMNEHPELHAVFED